MIYFLILATFFYPVLVSDAPGNEIFRRVREHSVEQAEHSERQLSPLLLERERVIVEFVEAYKTWHYGRLPTFDDIGDRFGLSRGEVSRILKEINDYRRANGLEPIVTRGTRPPRIIPSEREKVIIEFVKEYQARYSGLLPGIDDIGDELDLSRERVRQILIEINYSRQARGLEPIKTRGMK